MNEVVSLLGAIKTAMDLTKVIYGSGVTLEQAEQKLKLAELMTALADAQVKGAEVQGQLIEKDREIAALTEKLETKENLEWESPFYWRKTGERRDGPFCQRCYDADCKLLRLHMFQQGNWECKACTQHYKDKTYVSSVGRVIRSRDPFEY